MPIKSIQQLRSCCIWNIKFLFIWSLVQVHKISIIFYYCYLSLIMDSFRNSLLGSIYLCTYKNHYSTFPMGIPTLFSNTLIFIHSQYPHPQNLLAIMYIYFWFIFPSVSKLSITDLILIYFFFVFWTIQWIGWDEGNLLYRWLVVFYPDHSPKWRSSIFIIMVSFLEE